MRPTGVFVDANLLVLLIVGRTDRGLIARHRRLRAFSEEDYKRLLLTIEKFDKVFVTPNTLTEASNLLAQHGEPERSRLFGVLRLLIDKSEEIVLASATAARNSAFTRLGLTDAALLEVVSEETPLLTVDFDLYWAALEKGQGVVYNFTHFRSL